MTTATQVKSQIRNDVSLLSHVKYEHLVAGLSGGLVSTLVLHPLDVIKIRFAVNDGRCQTTPRYSGILNAFSTIYKEEGVRGLYRGVTPNCWGAATSWGLYFLFYNSLKNFVQKGDSETPLTPPQHLMIAAEAGAGTLLFTNPIWVVKTRMCLQYGIWAPNKEMYNGMIDALTKIYTQEGIKGYYRGLLPGLFGVSHGAIQFMVYEELKNKYNQYQGRSITTKLGQMEYLTFAAVSKLVAAAITYPYQVVRARLQNQYYSYEGAADCIVRTWSFEGWRGFYKGLGTNLLRVTPATMITFLAYENIIHFLLKRNAD